MQHSARQQRHLARGRRYREAFEALGTSLEGQGVQLAPVAPTAYRVFFEAGRPGQAGPSQLDLLTDEAAMAAQLEGEEPGAGEGYRWGAVAGGGPLPCPCCCGRHCCVRRPARGHVLRPLCRRFLRMARRHLDMGVPFFIDRELGEVANLQGLKVGRLAAAGGCSPAWSPYAHRQAQASA